MRGVNLSIRVDEDKTCSLHAELNLEEIGTLYGLSPEQAVAVKGLMESVADREITRAIQQAEIAVRRSADNWMRR